MSGGPIAARKAILVGEVADLLARNRAGTDRRETRIAAHELINMIERALLSSAPVETVDLEPKHWRRHG